MRILETVVTTINPDDSVNCAAMGVEWGERRIVIKPYRGTRTLRNLRATEAAVVNVTDDILLFSQAALGDPHPPIRRAANVEGAVLDDACSWREVRVEQIDDGESARQRQVRRWSAVAADASSSASIARPMRSSRRRSSLRGHGMLEAEFIRPSWAGSRCSWIRRPGPREREAMAYVPR